MLAKVALLHSPLPLTQLLLEENSPVFREQMSAVMAAKQVPEAGMPAV